MQLHQGVMFVQHGRIPGLRDESHEAFFRGGGVCPRDNAKTLNDAEVVRINRERTATQSGEVHDGRGYLRANTLKLFYPAADLVCTVAGEEIQ